jgi:hypothetical protein
MTAKTNRQNWLTIASIFALACSSTAAFADGPASAKQFAEQYIAAFKVSTDR